MSRFRLSVFAASGQQAFETEVSPLASAHQLDRVYWSHLAGTGARYAVLQDGAGLHGVFLARDLMPACARRLGLQAAIPGRWLTSALRLPASGLAGHAAIGPGLLLNLAELDSSERWMLPLLQRLNFAITAQEIPFGMSKAALWHAYSQSWLWHEGTLYGAGSITPERLLSEAPPDGLELKAWLCEAGALRLP